MMSISCLRCGTVTNTVPNITYEPVAWNGIQLIAPQARAICCNCSNPLSNPEITRFNEAMPEIIGREVMHLLG